MDSIELQILKAAQVALNRPQITHESVTFVRPDGLQVFRGRLTPLEDDEFPAAVLFFDEEEAERAGGRWGPLTQRTAALTVEIAVTGEPVNDVLDPIETWVVLAIMTDEALAELVDSLQEEGTKREADFLEEPIAGAAIRFAVSYHTHAIDRTRRS